MAKRFGFEIERCNNYGREMTCNVRLFQMAHAYKNSVTMKDVKDVIEYTVKSDGFKDELGVLAERITKDIIESSHLVKTDVQLDDIRRGVVEVDKYSIYGSPVFAEYHFIAVMIDRRTWFLNKATGEIKRYLDLEYILSKAVDDSVRRASIISDAIYMVNRCFGGGVEFAITEFNNGIEYKNIETLIDSLKRFKNYFNISDETLISLVKEGILWDGFNNDRCNDETHYSSEKDKEVALMIKALNTLLDLPEVEAEVAPANVKDERDGLIEAGFTWERYKSTARISDNTVKVTREQVIKATGDYVEGVDNIRKAIEFGRGLNGKFEELAEYLLDNNLIPEGASYICKMTIKGSPNYCNFFYEAIGVDSMYYLYDVWNKKFSTQLNIDDIYASRDVQQPWFQSIEKVIEISGFDKDDPITIFENVKVSSETVEKIAENGNLRLILRDLGFEYGDQKLDEIVHNIVIKLQKAEQEIDIFGEEEAVTEDEAVVSPQKVIIGPDALSVSRFDDQIMVDKYHKPLGMLAEMTGACGIALIDKDPICGDDIKGVVSCEAPKEIMDAYQLIVDKKYNHIKFLSAWEMQKWEELDGSLQESIKAESPICLYDETLEGHTDFCKKKGGFVRSIEECIDFEPIPEASSYEWSLLEGIIGEHITREEIKKNEYYKDLIVSKLGEIRRVLGENMVSDLRSLVLSN